MSGPSRDRDAGWLRYEGGDQPDPASNSESASDSTASVDADALGQQDARGATPDSAWLRHDLPEAGADAPGPTPARDAAWLEPDVGVPGPTPEPEHSHDTGVPPTIVVEAEEATPAHVSSATSPLPAADDRHDGVDPDEAGSGDAGGAGDAGERPARRGGDDNVGGLAVLGAALKEFAIVVGMALVLSFIVKTWLLQAFYIPSGSMEDTLVLNDRVIVSKLTPGPVDLKRGDIIVFADPGQWLDETPAAKQGPVATVVTETLTFVGLLPDNAENHLIKRVIGLPGDHVVCCDEGGRITINGTAIKEPYLKPGDAASEQDFDVTVPSGRVWVMGDHRSNSADSRAHDGPENNGSQGSVDERLIVGRAVALVWPLDHLTWLSNPTATFANVPAPSADTTPQGTSGTDGQGGGEGGGEVGGTDTPTGSG